MIVNNVINPLKGLPEKGIKGLDVNRHLSRRVSNTVKVYLNSIKQAKRYHRLSLVGYHKYLYEFYNDHDYLEKVIFESEVDYYDTNKYSNVTEFTHHDLEVL
jgi:hypothetical protein